MTRIASTYYLLGNKKESLKDLCIENSDWNYEKLFLKTGIKHRHILDKNERTLKKNNIHLKITEKEIDFIENLHVSSKPLSREFILKNIWNYSADADTHTVETHIYRLRQKIKNQFKDNSFIKNSKKGYSL